MKDKKNIDRLFRERLKDLEVTPSDTVWNNISSELNNSIDKSNNRKGIPVWWRIAGIAAGLLLLLTLGQKVLNNNETVTPEENIIVNINSEKDALSPETSSKSNNGIDNGIIENSAAEVSKFKPSPSLNKVLVKSNSGQSEDKVSNNQDKVSTNRDKDNGVIGTMDKNKYANVDSSNKEASGASTSFGANRTSPEVLNLDNSGNLQNNSLTNINTLNTAKAMDSLNEPYPSTEGLVFNLDGLDSPEDSQEIDAIIKEEDKLSLTEEIIATSDEDDEEGLEESLKRWSVAPNIAPVYFNTLGSGSSIHPEFIENSKTGDINMSYGITTSYAINKKLSIRAGIQKVNLGYSTDNVVVYYNLNGPSNAPLLRLSQNIEFTESAQNISFINISAFNFAQVPGPVSSFIKSSIDQKLGFIEIPLELKYNLSDKKMSVNVIGGFSTFFLNNNEVYSVDNGKSILLGKATNINNTSFSANFGLGFDFKMTDKIKLNLEPVFKYQLNTFNNTSGDFKPYFFGVYSGLSFKF